MPKGYAIDAETKSEIVMAYLSDEKITQKEIAKRFGVSTQYVSRMLKSEMEAGNGVKPDRRARTAHGEITDGEIERRHQEAMQEHPRSEDWMAHVTPLHKHKQSLEEKVKHKQAELDAAKQELRDFTATLEQLLKAD